MRKYLNGGLTLENKGTDDKQNVFLSELERPLNFLV